MSSFMEERGQGLDYSRPYEYDLRKSLSRYPFFKKKGSKDQIDITPVFKVMSEIFRKLDDGLPEHLYDLGVVD